MTDNRNTPLPPFFTTIEEFEPWTGIVVKTITVFRDNDGYARSRISLNDLPYFLLPYVNTQVAICHDYGHSMGIERAWGEVESPKIEICSFYTDSKPYHTRKLVNGVMCLFAPKWVVTFTTIPVLGDKKPSFNMRSQESKTNRGCTMFMAYGDRQEFESDMILLKLKQN